MKLTRVTCGESRFDFCPLHLRNLQRNLVSYRQGLRFDDPINNEDGAKLEHADIKTSPSPAGATCYWAVGTPEETPPCQEC
jgi:hypothetical protein